ncbi:Glutathione S-transferase kappa 1 [Armadillidium nasatum]|uniref:Glutathione S-transferase kappa 1 n=1 Tax=Armadillidium nasatum TaxID=96803 RepID=A0A5N5T6A2_9CRUS|nr:Glutathione S-transferase kappa 1 [Armadillidium nasatum]
MSNEEFNDVMAKLNSDEVKSKLKEATNYAVECEAFGVPTTVVHLNNHKHMFFGSDRFPLIAQELEEEWKGPVPDKLSKL